MTRQIVLRAQGSDAYRREPLLENADYSSRGGVRKVRLAEVAGGTTADCVAVCCCCPCGLANLLVLAVYKLPAGLCRKALRRKRRRRLMNKGAAPPRSCGCEEEQFQIHAVTTSHLAMDNAIESLSDNKEVIELEKEMWDKFHGAGFWRNPSQRAEIEAQCKRKSLEDFLDEGRVLQKSARRNAEKSLRRKRFCSTDKFKEIIEMPETKPPKTPEGKFDTSTHQNHTQSQESACEIFGGSGFFLLMYRG